MVTRRRSAPGTRISGNQPRHSSTVTTTQTTNASEARVVRPT